MFEMSNADLEDTFVEMKARVLTHPIFGDISSEPKSRSVLEGRKPMNRRASSFGADAHDHDPNSNTHPINEGVANDVLETRSSNPSQNCPLCRAPHWLSQCKEFRSRSVRDRYELVREKELCYNCLIPGHYASTCPKSSFCKVDGCSDKHSTFLHPPAARVGNETQPEIEAQSAYVDVGESRCAFTGAGTSVTGLPVVSVKVRAKGGDTMVHTYAFLDGGSNTSFCSDQLMKQLRIKGINTTLSLTTMKRENSTKRSALVQLEVFDFDENNFIELPLVFSTPKLPIASESIPSQDDVDRWPHLKGIHVTEIEANVGLNY